MDMYILVAITSMPVAELKTLTLPSSVLDGMH